MSISKIITATLLTIAFLTTSERATAMPLGVSETILSTWEKSMSKHADFEKSRILAIDSMKAAELSMSINSPAKAPMLLRIGEAYEGIDIDSSLHYYKSACYNFRKNGLTDDAIIARSKRISLLPLRNKLHEATIELGLIDFSMVTNPRIRREIWLNILRSYQRIAHYSTSTRLRNEAISKASECVDTLMAIVDESTPLYNYLLGLHLSQAGKTTISNASLQAAIDSTANDSPLSIQASMSLIRNLFIGGNKKESLETALRLSTELSEKAKPQAEILLLLSEIFYDANDIDRAYECLSMALDHAVQSGDEMDALMAASNYSDIVASFTEKQESRRKQLTNTIAVLGIMLTFALIALAWTNSPHRNKRKKNESVPRDNDAQIASSDIAPPLEANLDNSNPTNGQWLFTNPEPTDTDDATVATASEVGSFLNLSNIFIDKLEDFRKTARIKISTGKVNELYAQLRSEKPDISHAEIFSEVFDDAFLKLYPSFVDDMNAMLRPESQIAIEDQTKLNTELRIFALMKLGIDDASKIARFIGVSVNTIYTYRNKMRSRAIDREQFEASMMPQK